MLLAAAVPGAAAPADEAASGPHAEPAAEKVLGIGGLFFRAADPKGLARWYFDNLGIATTPMHAGDQPWHTDAGVTSFTPFSQKSTYLGPPTQAWMVNFRVRDLEKMAAQLRGKGITVDVDPQAYPYGRFARLHDPEGNPIELWQPA